MEKFGACDVVCEVDDAVTRQVQRVRKGDMRDVASSTSACLDVDAKRLSLVAR